MADIQTDRDQDSGGGKLLSDLGELVAHTSRLLTGLGSLEPLRDAKITLADWVALKVLAEGEPKNNRHLARALGVTRQRANQIKTALEERRLISSTQSSADARENVLAVTEKGSALLDEVNGKVLTILLEILKGDSRLLRRANRSVRGLVRLVRGSQQGKSTGDRDGLVRRRPKRVPRVPPSDI